MKKQKFITALFLWIFIFTAACGETSEKEDKGSENADNVIKENYFMFNDQDKTISVSTNVYKVEISKEHGAIHSIEDMVFGLKLSEGSGNLWQVHTSEGSYIKSSSYMDGFSYAYNECERKLSLIYDGNIEVKVDILFEDSFFKMKLSVCNKSAVIIDRFFFPGDIPLNTAEIKEGLLPMIPGILLDGGFFTGGKSFRDTYPGVMFADFLSVRFKESFLTLYSINNGVVQPVEIGFGFNRDAYINHMFFTFIEKNTEYTLPEVVIEIGGGYGENAISYREDNGFDKFPSLAQKLGNKKEGIFDSVMYKLDMDQTGLKFSELHEKVIKSLPLPGIIHLVAFQTNGHDRNYPDFVPADPKFGTTEDFIAFVKNSKQDGNYVIPYTNFSWWDTRGPSLLNLPEGTEITDVCVVKGDGMPLFETYGNKEGYVVNLYNGYVNSRISGQHKLLMENIGVDGILEDQWGARSAMYDYNTNTPVGLDPSTSYFQGILSHGEKFRNEILMTECGIDMLAKSTAGFAGTNLLWAMAGYRKTIEKHISYYPLIGMMLRDKTLLYQHDLAGETFTKDNELFCWNLCFGYQLSNFVKSGQWQQIAAVFQKYVLSKYADELITGFETVEENVTLTNFESFKVYSLNGKSTGYTVNGHTIAKSGAGVFSRDAKISGGIFTSFNGEELEGEHIIIEIRNENEIIVFHPKGKKTLLTINVPVDWKEIKMESFNLNGDTFKTYENIISKNGKITFEAFNQELLNDFGYYKFIKK